MTSKPVILAIDDTPANLRTLGAALMADYDLQVALSGAEGLAHAAASAPDLILLDIMMPEMDGYEVCRRLKTDDRLKLIPVVLITAMTESEAQIAGLELGVADYLTKPINVSIARLRIRNLLERELFRKQAERHRDQLEALVKERTLSLSIAKEAAEAATIAKRDFIANMNHELRTPLHQIHGMAHLIRRDPLTPRQKERLGMLDEATRRITGILDAIIKLADLEAKYIALADAPIDIEALIEDAVIKAQAAAGQLPMIVEPVAIPAGLYGDAGHIKMALLNYLNNAIRFAESGHVTVRARLAGEDETGAIIRFEVEDTGIGIAAQDQSRLFNIFEQVDNSSTRKHGGLGIGLAMTRKLVRLMGGDAGCDSRLGEGSLFWFTVRLKKAGPTAS